MASVPGSMFGRLLGMTRGEGLRAQLLRGGIGSIAVKIASTGLAFAVAVVLARVLGPEGYGIYAYAFALISLLAIPAQFGLPNLVIRETAKAQANEDWGLMRGIWHWATGMAGAISLALALIAGGLAWVFADRFSEAQLATIAWGLLLVPFMALTAVLGAAVRGLSHVIAGQFSENLLRPLLLVVFLLGLLVLSGTIETPSSAMMMHAAAAAFGLIVGWHILRRLMPLAAKGVPNFRYDTRIWVKAAFPLAAVSSIHILNRTTDMLIIGIFLPAEDVGYFRVAVQVALVIAFASEALNFVIGPQFAKSFASNNPQRSKNIVRFSIIISASFSIIVGLLVIFNSNIIIATLFGEEYGKGATILEILSVGQIVTSSFGVCGLLLSIAGHERVVAQTLIFSVVINIVFNILLIPTYGTAGAALSTVLASIFWVIILLNLTRKRIMIDPLKLLYQDIKTFVHPRNWHHALSQVAQLIRKRK